MRPDHYPYRGCVDGFMGMDAEEQQERFRMMDYKRERFLPEGQGCEFADQSKEQSEIEDL